MLFQIILYADKLTFLDFFYEYMGVTPQVKGYGCQTIGGKMDNGDGHQVKG